MRPAIKEKIPFDLFSTPVAPAYEAGYLTEVNSGFRNSRPVCDKDKCNGCFLCYLYCPDGAISKNGKTVNIDYDFCKGCGICTKICRKAAITMESEK